MTPTQCRDQVSRLAKTDHAKAASIADKITDPWFRAQAYAHLARHAEVNPLPFCREAARSARKCKDDYQRSAVRAWEIVALAERGHSTEARQALSEAVELAKLAEPVSSRAEALILLLQAALYVSKDEASAVADALITACSAEHWRAKRARRDATRILSGKMQPRPFFW